MLPGTGKVITIAVYCTDRYLAPGPARGESMTSTSIRWTNGFSSETLQRCPGGISLYLYYSKLSRNTSPGNHHALKGLVKKER
jgi:hypothetical protein